MAPEETSTTSAPRARRPASASTRALTCCGSMPPSAVVSDEDPTLTTTREAPATSGRAGAFTPGPLRCRDRRGRPLPSPSPRPAPRQRPRRRRGTPRAGGPRRRGSPLRSLVVMASWMARRRRAAGRLSSKRVSSPRRPRISAPASTIGLKSNTTALSTSPIITASPSWAPSSRSRSSTPSRLSRSARKPTASSLLKSVCRTQRSGFSPRTRQPSAGLLDRELRAPGGSGRPDHDAGRLRGRSVAAGDSDDLSHRERQLTQSFVACRRHREHREPALLEVGQHDVGEVAAVGDVDLVERRRAADGPRDRRTWPARSR